MIVFHKYRLIILSLCFFTNCKSQSTASKVDLNAIVEMNSSQEGLNLAFTQSDPYRKEMVLTGREIVRKLMELQSNKTELTHNPEGLLKQLGVPPNFPSQSILACFAQKPTELTAAQRLMFAVSAVVWAEYAENTVAAKSIAFAVKDDSAIFNFLARYGDIVKSEGMWYERDPNKGKTSHLHYEAIADEKGFPMQYGLDLRMKKNGKLLELLPNNKTHILYGSYNTDPATRVTYIKTEVIGIGTLQDRLVHGINFLESLQPGAKSGDFRGEKIPKKGDKAVELLTILNKYQISPKDLKKTPLFKVIQNKVQDGKLSASDEINLVNDLKDLFPSDSESMDIQTRLGFEVQINHTDLKTADGRRVHALQDAPKYQALKRLQVQKSQEAAAAAREQLNRLKTATRTAYTLGAAAAAAAVAAEAAAAATSP